MRGEAARAYDTAEAERLATEGLAVLGLPDDPAILSGRGKWMPEKAVVAALIRQQTGVGNLWVAGRLGMGHEGTVTRAVRWTREDPDGRMSLQDLEAMLKYRDWSQSGAISGLSRGVAVASLVSADGRTAKHHRAGLRL